MNDEEQVFLELPDEALAKAAQRNDVLAAGAIDWWIERSDEEWTRDANPIEPAARDARLQRMQVELDVR